MDGSCDIRGAALAVPPNQFPDPERDLAAPEADGPLPGVTEQTAVLAGGCFWCVEAVLKELDGVHEVLSGYAGGTAQTANYQAVCSGRTDHAEVVQVRFDPARITFGQLLKVFLSVAHDPTQLDRQGNDRGRQYRSAIFFADAAQKEVAEAYIRQLNAAGVFKAPIVTRIEPLEAFYPAEAYHQDYAARNPAQPYIAYTATPKVEKLRAQFADRLKRD
jgi:peptide-methionine (S)-S-oxide reductase